MLSICRSGRPLTIASTVLMAGFATAALSQPQEAVPARHHANLSEPRVGSRIKAAKPTKRKNKSVEHAQDAAHSANHAGMPSTHDKATQPRGMHGHDASHDMQMKGFFGPYPMTREGSGTSWLPDSTPDEGVHVMAEDWMLMAHGLFNGVYDKQGGPRGGEKAFASGMLMGMAERQIGDGTLGFKAMLSPDPFMGRSGYPLLLATGETADGVKPLIDRQHPHDLFMELAGSYSYNLSPTSSVFVYGGLPGEPALGPPAFMHRTSGMDIPEAPITHHWLDSTHITYGVVTIGTVLDQWKLEGSAFKGREPDQNRFDIEAPRLDSFSGRLSWNPTTDVSMQVSYGRLKSPEQLSPDVNEDRVTASIIYTTKPWDDALWSSTFAWGRKMNHPGNTLDGLMLESALVLKNTWTFFLRAERVQEDELFDTEDESSTAQNKKPIFTVNKLSAGAIYDFHVADHLKLGIGGLVSKYAVPSGLLPPYGRDSTSFMAFVRLKLI